MKKLLLVLASIGMAFSIVACGNNNAKIITETEPPRLSYEISIVTGPGSIEDGKENEAIWKGIVKYAEENKILYKSFQAPDDSTIELFTKIEAAIADGAMIVVCVGDEQGEAVYYGAQSYPEVHFILIDGVPHDSEKSTYSVGNNVISVLYDGKTTGLIRKTIDEGGNSQVSTKLTGIIYDIIKDHYKGKFEGGSKKILQ